MSESQRKPHKVLLIFSVVLLALCVLMFTVFTAYTVMFVDFVRSPAETGDTAALSPEEAEAARDAERDHAIGVAFSLLLLFPLILLLFGFSLFSAVAAFVLALRLLTRPEHTYFPYAVTATAIAGTLMSCAPILFVAALNTI